MSDYPEQDWGDESADRTVVSSGMPGRGYVQGDRAASSQGDSYGRSTVRDDESYQRPYAGNPVPPNQRAAYTQRRPVVEAPPQQPAYVPGEDPYEGGGAVVSHRVPVDWRVWVKRIALAVVALLAVLVLVSVVSCAFGQGRGVADAGSNAVGSSDLSGSKSSGSSSTSSSSKNSDSSGSSSSGSSGSNAGDQTLGNLFEGATDKLGSLDLGNVTDKLGDAASSLGSGLSDLAGAASDVVNQLVN